MTYEEALRRIRRWKKAKNPRKWLNLSYLNLERLPPLPSKLRKLKCNGNSINILKGLPKKIILIECSYNDDLVSIDGIPDSVLYLTIKSCYSLKLIRYLPYNLKSLYLEYNGGLCHISYLPSKLEYLSISESPLECIPTLPDSLMYVNLLYTHISELPNLPKYLESLIINSCYITRLPQLPNSLKYLYIRGTKINTYPLILPENIIYFECNDSKYNIGVVKYYNYPC